MAKKDKKEQILDYKIVLLERAGGLREIKTFQATRLVDEDKTPFIYNEALKFMELYPQDIKDINPLKEKDIDAKIKKTEDILNKIKNKPIEEYKENEPNTEDLEFDLMKLKAKKRGLKYSDNSDYGITDEKGQVTFHFIRKSNSFFPFKWDSDTTTIHTASEPVVKKAGILLRNKETKYMPKKLIETSTLILLAILIIGVIANVALGGWLWTKYDDSNLGEIERRQLEINNICSELIVNNAGLVVDMQEEFKENIKDQDTTQIVGIIP